MTSSHKDEDNDSALWQELGADQEKDQINQDSKLENVQVIIRCRPSLKERHKPCLVVEESEKCIELEDRKFYYDSVFGPQATNDVVYMRSVRPLVDSAFKGYNCTIFLYGQTGTGKTYTHSSLTLSTFKHLFSLIQDSDKQARFLIRASYYEVYNEEIRDLLVKSNKALELRESKTRGVYIKDLTTYLANNLSELEQLKRLGDKQRSTASTKMNQHSSRSHSIFSITIEAVDLANNPSNSAGSARGKSSTTQTIRVGRLNLIDLAGSERQSKSGTSGAQLKEASRINLSLTCLSLVIRALTDPSSTHVPYRNSKLTRLLSSSLGGNSKTLLIACISNELSSLDETLNTLRFAQRTKKVKNDAKINEDPKDALLRKYRIQIQELKSKLRAKMSSSARSVGGSSSLLGDDEEAIESLATFDVKQQQHQNEVDSLKNNQDQTSINGRKEQEELLQQLRLLKNKIMVGGVNLLEKAAIHERLLEASKQELEEKRLKELKLKAELEKKQRLIENMAKSKGSLEGQVLELDEKLKRVLQMYHQTKEQQRDMASEHDQLKESLLRDIRATSKEIKYADCIINDFIPGEYATNTIIMSPI